MTAAGWTVGLPFGMLREMAKTFGGIEPYMGDRWCIRFRLDGRTHRIKAIEVHKRWIPIYDRRMAEEILDEIRYAIREGKPPIAAVAPYMQSVAVHGVGVWYAKWIEHQDARAESGQITAQRVRKLRAHLTTGKLDALRSTPIHDLRFSHLDDLQAGLLRTGLAPKSIRHVLADFRTFLGWLEERGMIQAVPKAPRVMVPRYLPDIPLPAQQEAILGAIEWEWRGFFLARGYMGLRPAEAMRARLEDYRRGAADNGSEDVLRVRAKGNRDRLVPVDLEVARWVRAHRPLLAPAGTLLFPSPTGTQWPEQTARRWLLRAMKTACGRTWKPNEAMRHCFGTRAASLMLRTGSAQQDVIRQIMTVMGHTSHVTSARYVSLSADSLRGILPNESGQQGPT